MLSSFFAAFYNSSFTYEFSFEKKNLQLSDLSAIPFPWLTFRLRVLRSHTLTHLHSFSFCFQNFGGFFLAFMEDSLNVLYASPNVSKFVQFSQKDLIGVPITRIAHQDDHPKVKKLLGRAKSKLPEVRST